MTYLLIIKLAPSPSQIPHTPFDIISLGGDAVLCHDHVNTERFSYYVSMNKIRFLACE